MWQPVSIPYTHRFCSPQTYHSPSLIVSRSRSRMEIPTAHTGGETGELSFHGLLHEVFLASTSVLMFIPHNSISFGIASRLNICSSRRSSCPIAFSGDCNSKAIYSKISLKLRSACSDNSTSYIISHNPCECQQMLSSHFCPSSLHIRISFLQFFIELYF